MLIQVNSDQNFAGQELTTWVTDTLEKEFERYSHHITRLEVHLSDENSDKQGGGGDKRCLIEARLEGKPPLVVSHKAARLNLALDGAADKLLRLVADSLEKSRDKRRSGGRVPHEMPEPPDEA